MDADEDEPSDSPVHLSNDQWEQAIIQALVRLTTLAWKITSEGARATQVRLSSHGAILFLALTVIVISGLNVPAVAREAPQPESHGGGASFAMPASAVKAASSLRPALATGNGVLVRMATPLTQIPDRPREAIITYTVGAGDTLFGIALQFELAPETVLWANPDLKDNPDMLNMGMVLNIPPIDGVVHVVAEGDTVQSIAEEYEVSPEAIIIAEWNSLRPGQPLNAGQHLIVPGGKRELVVWQIPVQPTADSTVSSYTYSNAGFCESVTVSPLGSGTFIWPEDNHRLGGNPYAWWHRAIDIIGDTGNPVYASDSGTVVYAGWNTWGYGNLIVLDHGNGWQTWYAHLSQIYVRCGQQLYQGANIGAVGSTGRSTGPHLHFETRLNGDLPNPLSVLP